MGHQDFRQARHEFEIDLNLGGKVIDQAVWSVDSENGNDANPGTAARPLKSIPEFNRRIGGGIISEPIEVLIFGSHIDEPVQFFGQFTRNGTMAVRGMSATILTTQTITGFTANNPAGGEARTITVTGFDWTPYIGKRIRFTDGPAVGAVCWIAIDDPASAGTDTVRVTPVGNTLVDFSTTITFVDPVVSNTFVIEDPTRIGGINLDILQGASNVGPLTGRVVQFSDFDTTPGSGSTTLAPGTPNGVIFTRSLCNSILAGPGLIDPTLCHWNGVLASSNISCVLRSCLGTSSVGVMLVSSATDFNVLDCIFQNATLTVRTRLIIAQNCGYFDRAGDAIQVDAGATLFSRDTSFGSGNTGFGMNLNGGAVVTFDTLPEVSGTAGDLDIGGTVSTYAALPTLPINGAGVYPN